MRLYAAPGRLMARQLLGDLFVLAWVLGWAAAAWLLHRAVSMLAGPAQRTAETARSLAESMSTTRERVSGLPVVGDELSTPFGSLSTGLGQVVTQAQDQVSAVERLAWVVSAVCFLMPVLSLLALWLPGRARFVREASAAQALLRSGADLDLFALRAMSTLPLAEVARISPDPVGAWRRGDQQVTRALAQRELARQGLALGPGAGRPR